MKLYKSGATPATCDRRRHCALCRNLRREHPECGHEYEDTCSYGATPATKADIVSAAHLAAYRAHVVDGHACDEDHIAIFSAMADEIERLRTPASIPSDLEERLERHADDGRIYIGAREDDLWLNAEVVRKNLREASSALRTLREEIARLNDEEIARLNDDYENERKETEAANWREACERAEAEVTRLREALGRLRTKAIMAGMHFPAEPHFINAGVVCDCEKDLRDEVVAARSLLSVKEGEGK